MKTATAHELFRDLGKAERDLRHALLHSKDGWQSLDIDYHPPYVQRLWRAYGDYRLYLHCISPCNSEESLFHPHLGPSVMRIHCGTYWMKIGAGAGKDAPPVVADLRVTINAREGEGEYTYAMPHSDGWHAVTPVGGPVYSTMLIGTPWIRPVPAVTAAVSGTLKPLSTQKMELLFEAFRGIYGLMEKS